MLYGEDGICSGSSGFEYLKKGKEVGKGKGRETSDYLHLLLQLGCSAQETKDHFQNCTTLPLRTLRGHSQARKGNQEQHGTKARETWQDAEKRDSPWGMGVGRETH